MLGSGSAGFRVKRFVAFAALPFGVVACGSSGGNESSAGTSAIGAGGSTSQSAGAGGQGGDSGKGGSGGVDASVGSGGAMPSTGTTYYVSPAGSDTNAGTLSAPFLTIAKARDVVRTVNSQMAEDI